MLCILSIKHINLGTFVSNFRLSHPPGFMNKLYIKFLDETIPKLNF